MIYLFIQSKVQIHNLPLIIKNHFMPVNISNFHHPCIGLKDFYKDEKEFISFFFVL